MSWGLSCTGSTSHLTQLLLYGNCTHLTLYGNCTYLTTTVEACSEVERRLSRPLWDNSHPMGIKPIGIKPIHGVMLGVFSRKCDVTSGEQAYFPGSDISMEKTNTQHACMSNNIKQEQQQQVDTELEQSSTLMPSKRPSSFGSEGAGDGYGFTFTTKF